MFADKAGTYLNEVPFKAHFLDCLWAFPKNITIFWNSGLLGTFLIYIHQSFYNIDISISTFEILKMLI
jgi:hypothetical protein